MAREVYDLSWDTAADGTIVSILEPDGDGGKRVVREPAPFDPYCYVEEDGLDTSKMARNNVRMGDDHPDGYVRVEGDDPNAIRDYADEVLRETRESDVGFSQRVLIDTDWGVAVPDEGDVLYFDIEVDDRGEFAEPGLAPDRVISIAAVGGDGREFYSDDEDEEELLRSFLGFADDYVALAGWNAEGYDFPYLENRLERIGKSVDWRRWVRVDVMPLYDMLAVPTQTVDTNLDDTAERELGEGKAPVEAGGGDLWELWRESPDELREYNMRDSEIVRQIDSEYGLVRLLHTICDICNYPPGEACYESKHGQVRFAIGQVVDAKLLEVANRKGRPQRDKRSYEKPDDFPGGYVLDPKPGLYEDVVAPDYSGMYPNIVRAWNFGEETWVPDSDLEEIGGVWYITEGEWAGCRAIKGETGGFVHPEDQAGERSVPAEAADELVEMRDGAAEIVDKGVKAVNNCFSGDTAVMTPDRGPVNIKELEIGDEVYSIDPDTLQCEVKPVVDTTAEPNNYGELVHFDGEAVDLKVTPNHRMLSARPPVTSYEIREARDMETGEWRFPHHSGIDGEEPETLSILDEAEGRIIVDHDVHGRTFTSQVDNTEYDGNRGAYRIPVDAFVEQRETVEEFGDVDGVQRGPHHSVVPIEYDIEQMLELAGWYTAEGHVCEKTGHTGPVTVVEIAQQDDDGRARISDLLDEMGIQHAVYDHGVTISNENLASWLSSNFGNGSEDKGLPEWVFSLDHTLLERLRTALMAGDGCNDGRGSVKYTTVSDGLRDDFARLMVHTGRKLRLREDGAYRIHENRTEGIQGSRNASREDHDGMVYCVSVADNHTVLAGRNGTFQWTGQTLYGVFAADHQRYFGPHSENITLVGQQLTGKIEEIAGAGHSDIDKVVYGDTDSIMVSMDEPKDPVDAAYRISDAVESEMKEWAAGRGAFDEYLELDVDDVYDRFYIGDKKKRYFGHRIHKDGEAADDFKMRGFEARQGSWPEPVRDFQVELMHAVLDDEPTQPIVERYRDALFSGEYDAELAQSMSLTKPVDEYETPLPHTRAAEQIRDEFGERAVTVGDKVKYVKYGDDPEDVTWARDGEMGRDLRSRDYSYIWDKKFDSVAESIGVETEPHEQTGLGDF